MFIPTEELKNAVENFKKVTKNPIKGTRNEGTVETAIYGTRKW